MRKPLNKDMLSEQPAGAGCEAATLIRLASCSASAFGKHRPICIAYLAGAELSLLLLNSSAATWGTPISNGRSFFEHGSSRGFSVRISTPPTLASPFAAGRSNPDGSRSARYAGAELRRSCLSVAGREERDGFDEPERRKPGAWRHVDMAISMVAYSHEDARRAIAMLKPVDAGDSDLLHELEEQGLRLTRGGDLRFERSAEGEARQLTERSHGALLRIGHEAITNAVRHASARAIRLALLFDRAASPCASPMTDAASDRAMEDGAGLASQACALARLRSAARSM